MEEIEASGFAPYYVDHTVGIWPQSAGGVPFNACFFQSKGDVITDLFEDMAADDNTSLVQYSINGGKIVQKLKNTILDKMMAAHLTKAEVDFMLEISHYQDESGKVYGVYYKDVCEAIGISYQTFYVTMESLVDKGLICLVKAYYGDWDIIIQGNDFTYPEAFSEGYISTGHDMFYDDMFRKLKANEKLLAMQFLKIAGAGKRYHIGVNVLYEKYTEILHVTKRTLQVYLGKLKQFFSVGIKDKMYWITPLTAVFKSLAPKDIQTFSEHLGEVACRRNRITYTGQELRNATELVKQYAQLMKDRIADVFLNAVSDSVIKVNQQIRDKHKWNRQLNPKFVHKLMKNTI